MDTTIADRINELCLQYGGLRKAAKRLGLSAPFLCQLRSGKKRPGSVALMTLGLKRVVDYARGDYEKT